MNLFLQKLAPEGETGRGHLHSVYDGEESRGVMTFNSDDNPTSCGRSGPLPSEVTDDRGGNQTQACPLQPKLMDRDARVSAVVFQRTIIKVEVNPRGAKPEGVNKRVGADRKVALTGVAVEACGLTGASGPFPRGPSVPQSASP